MKVKTSTLALLGLFIALGVVLGMNIFSFDILIGGVAAKKLSFSLLPAILSGFLFGPLAGLAVGALIDILRAVLFPIGGLAYNPLFTIPFALMAATPAFLCGLAARGNYRHSKARPNFLMITLAVLVSQLVWSCGLNTFLIASMYGRAFLGLLPARLLGLLLCPVNAFLLQILMKTYDKVRR